MARVPRKKKQAPEQLPTPARTFGVDDLEEALLTAHSRRNWPEKERAYFDLRSSAFSKAFGISGSRNRYLSGLVPRLLAGAVVQVSPFAGMLEAPPVIVKYYERFGGKIRSAEEALQSEVRQMLRAVLEDLASPRVTVTSDELLAHGFDVALQPPAADDDW